jgi:hypothetical protein
MLSLRVNNTDAKNERKKKEGKRKRKGSVVVKRNVWSVVLLLTRNGQSRSMLHHSAPPDPVALIRLGP